MKNPIRTLVDYSDSVAAGINHLFFAKFERLTAAFCTMIPVFLLITGTIDEKRNLNLLWWPFGIILFTVFAIPWLSKWVSGKFEGAILTVLAGLVFLGFYQLFIHRYELKNFPSISAYVGMRDNFIFGMLLA